MPDGRADESVRRGLVISALSFAWTLLAGTAAITFGVIGNSLVLAAFGAIGLMDALGSASLLVHFRHALRHTTLSERYERIALRLVTIGMMSIGVATIAISSYRLASHAHADSLSGGIAVASASVVVLPLLAGRKRRIAPLIPSPALHADGWLSAIGALLALITLAGTAVNGALGWWWSDPVAAICVAGAAIALGTVLARGHDLNRAD